MELVSWLVSKCCAKFITQNKFRFFCFLITDLVLFMPSKYHLIYLHSTGASGGGQESALCWMFDKRKSKLKTEGTI
jgi:hypothetical protein